MGFGSKSGWLLLLVSWTGCGLGSNLNGNSTLLNSDGTYSFDPTKSTAQTTTPVLISASDSFVAGCNSFQISDFSTAADYRKYNADNSDASISYEIKAGYISTVASGQTVCMIPIKYSATPADAKSTEYLPFNAVTGYACPALTVNGDSLPTQRYPTNTSIPTIVTEAQFLSGAEHTNGWGSTRDVTTGEHATPTAMYPEIVSFCGAHNLFNCLYDKIVGAHVTRIACMPQ